MKRSGVLHPDLLSVLAAAGHGDRIVLADAGLKVPRNARSIDLALVCGVPGIVEVVRAVHTELVVEAAVVATEFEEWNPRVYADVVEELMVYPGTMAHRDLMDEMAENAFVYVKTGECSAYSSVVLVCGVSYLDDAVALYKEIHGREPR